MTIKNFSIEYDSINGRNTFSNGDTMNGRIILEVSKDTKIQGLLFIAKGKARVCWSEHYGQHHHHVYRSSEKYYEVKHHILRESRQDGTEIVKKGRHVFPFTFTIPDRKIPSTFETTIGKIIHKVKAELKQSMKLTKKTKSHFTFVSKADMDIPGLMEPQYDCKDKSVKVFGSGNVSMDVHTKRMGYKQGEGIQVIAEINNRSSRSVKPKFSLYEKWSFFAQGRRRVQTNEILKDKIEAIASSGKETVTKVITIPRELPPSILNCSIIKLEYRLKVYLDIKCATDPVIKLPIVVLPAPEASAGKKMPPSADFGFDACGNSKSAFGNPTPAFGNSNPSFGNPIPSYGNPTPAYGNPTPAFGNPAPAYGNPTPAFGNPAPAYGNPTPAFGNPAPAYGNPSPAFGNPAPAYGNPTPAFGNPNPAFANPNPTPWGTTPPPLQVASRPVDPPPSYDATVAYPSLDNYGQYKSSL